LIETDWKLAFLLEYASVWRKRDDNLIGWLPEEVNRYGSSSVYSNRTVIATGGEKVPTRHKPIARDSLVRAGTRA
jgi:hypothetical protein